MNADRVELREKLAAELLEARRALERAMAGELVLLERVEQLAGPTSALDELVNEHAASHLALIAASERFGELLRVAAALRHPTHQAQA